MSTNELAFEFGPIGCGALPVAVMLSARDAGGRALQSEIAVDAEQPPHICRVIHGDTSEDYRLDPTELASGMIVYAQIDLPRVPKVRIDLLTEDGEIRYDLSFVADLASGLTFPIEEPRAADRVGPVPVFTPPPVSAPPALSRPFDARSEPVTPVSTPVQAAPAPVASRPENPMSYHPPAPTPSISQAGTSPARDPEEPATTSRRVPFDPPRRRLAAGEDADWPDSLGANGQGLGPEVAANTRALILTGARRTDRGGVEVDVLLQDEGVVSSLAIARDGKELLRVTPRRLTALSPAHVTFKLADPFGELLFVGTNAYGEAFTNLVATLDLDAVCFRKVAPERHVWGKYLRFTGDLDLSHTSCAACRAPVVLGKDVVWADLSVREREALRTQFPLIPEARGLCKTCHAELILSSQLLHVIVKTIAGDHLIDGVIRLVFAYLGALAICTNAGVLLGRFVDVGFQGGVEDSVSFTAVSAAFAAVMAVLPWPSLLRQCGRGWRGLLTKGRLPGATALLVPLVVGGGVWLGVNDLAVLPASFSTNFLGLHWHIAAWSGFTLSMLAVGALARYVDRMALERIAPHRQLMQLGKASLLTPKLFEVATRGQYEEAVERSLLEGLGALEFQLYSRRPHETEFYPARRVGAFSARGAELRFKEGDPHILGFTARTGYVISAADVGKGLLVAPDRLELKLPFVFCVPIWAQGRVAEIYCITRLRSTTSARESLHLAELIALAASQSLHRLSTESVAA